MLILAGLPVEIVGQPPPPRATSTSAAAQQPSPRGVVRSARLAQRLARKLKEIIEDFSQELALLDDSGFSPVMARNLLKKTDRKLMDSFEPLEAQPLLAYLQFELQNTENRIESMSSQGNQASLTARATNRRTPSKPVYAIMSNLTRHRMMRLAQDAQSPEDHGSNCVSSNTPLHYLCKVMVWVYEVLTEDGMTVSINCKSGLKSNEKFFLTLTLKSRHPYLNPQVSPPETIQIYRGLYSSEGRFSDAPHDVIFKCKCPKLYGNVGSPCRFKNYLNFVWLKNGSKVTFDPERGTERCWVEY